MKIITILLLMISTQAQAWPDEVDLGSTYPEKALKLCKISMSFAGTTIKLAMDGVPVAKALNKLRKSNQDISIRWDEEDTRAIYKTVDQIKTKYGQVRPEDKVALDQAVQDQYWACAARVQEIFGNNEGGRCEKQPAPGQTCF